MMKITISFLVFILLACSSPNVQDSEKLCKDFCSLNKDKRDLSVLFNVNIEARNERNKEFHYYYSHILICGDTLIVPSFEFFDHFYKEDSTIYNKNFVKLCKCNGVEGKASLVFSKEYAKKIDKIYKELAVINIKSNPNLGRFIEFKLNTNCTVYHLGDSTTLNSYWKEKFRKLKKVDNNWYYETK